MTEELQVQGGSSLDRVSKFLNSKKKLVANKEKPILLSPKQVDDLMEEALAIDEVLKTTVEALKDRKAQIRELVFEHGDLLNKTDKEPEFTPVVLYSPMFEHKFVRSISHVGGGQTDWEALQSELIETYGAQEGRKLILMISDPPPLRSRTFNSEKLSLAIQTGRIPVDLVQKTTMKAKKQARFLIQKFSKEDKKLLEV